MIASDLIYHGCRHAQSVEGCPFCAGAEEIGKLREALEDIAHGAFVMLEGPVPALHRYAEEVRRVAQAALS